MANNFQRQSGEMKDTASEQRFRINDLEEPALNSSDRFYPIFRVEGTKTKSFAPGVGYLNERFATGYADLDLQSTPDGGTTINATQGVGRWALYSDDTLHDPIAYSRTWNLANLREAVAEARKDKELMEGLAPAGKDGRNLVFEVSPDVASEGETVSAANCAVGLGIPYSMYRK